MKKRIMKTITFALVAAFMFSLLPAAASAAPAPAPATLTVVVPTGASTFTVDLNATGGNEPYAGIEFGLVISNEKALSFDSFNLGAALQGALSAPFMTEAGVHYFGFYAGSNAFRGQYKVGTLGFSGYTGNETVTITLSHMVVSHLLADLTSASLKNSEAVLVITVKREGVDGGVVGGGSTGGGGSNGSATITIPDIEAPTTEPETKPPVTEPEKGRYSDVANPSIWYYSAVYFVSDAGLMDGVGDNKFSPGTPLTRAMFVTMLGRLAEKQNEDTAGFSNPFRDVPANQWYTKYVAWAADKNIVNGHSATVFAPNDPVTREQMAALMIRFCDYMGIELGSDTKIAFTDAASISGWAASDVESAAAAGLMQGANGLFRPKATATRAEVAQLFMNFMQAYIK